MARGRRKAPRATAKDTEVAYVDRKDIGETYVDDQQSWRVTCRGPSSCSVRALHDEAFRGEDGEVCSVFLITLRHTSSKDDLCLPPSGCDEHFPTSRVCSGASFEEIGDTSVKAVSEAMREVTQERLILETGALHAKFDEMSSRLDQLSSKVAFIDSKFKHAKDLEGCTGLAGSISAPEVVQVAQAVESLEADVQGVLPVPDQERLQELVNPRDSDDLLRGDHDGVYNRLDGAAEGIHVALCEAFKGALPCCFVIIRSPHGDPKGERVICPAKLKQRCEEWIMLKFKECVVLWALDAVSLRHTSSKDDLCLPPSGRDEHFPTSRHSFEEIGDKRVKAVSEAMREATQERLILETGALHVKFDEMSCRLSARIDALVESQTTLMQRQSSAEEVASRRDSQFSSKLSQFQQDFEYEVGILAENLGSQCDQLSSKVDFIDSKFKHAKSPREIVQKPFPAQEETDQRKRTIKRSQHHEASHLQQELAFRFDVFTDDCK